jgi:hypothetical protein
VARYVGTGAAKRIAFKEAESWRAV